jgi:hypothetical protein
MKTLEQIMGYQSEALDGRDLYRLMDFIPEADLPKLKLELKPEYVGKHAAVPLTREAVLERLKRDLEFAFEKALNKRGISASLMVEVVAMWNWVLEEGLEKCPEDMYAQYGLPFLKATALKHGFENPIGDDRGDEFKYSAEGEY